MEILRSQFVTLDDAAKLRELEHKVSKHDNDILTIFEAIRQLMAPPPEKPRRIIGFKQE